MIATFGFMLLQFSNLLVLSELWKEYDSYSPLFAYVPMQNVGIVLGNGTLENRILHWLGWVTSCKSKTLSKNMKPVLNVWGCLPLFLAPVGLWWLWSGL